MKIKSGKHKIKSENIQNGGIEEIEKIGKKLQPTRVAAVFWVLGLLMVSHPFSPVLALLSVYGRLHAQHGVELAALRSRVACSGD